MNTVMKYFKNVLSIFAVILIIAVIVVPYILLIVYLRKNGQTISIYPKFEIREITRTEDTDVGVLGDAVIHANEILKKIRGENK